MAVAFEDVGRRRVVSERVRTYAFANDHAVRLAQRVPLVVVFARPQAVVDFEGLRRQAPWVGEKHLDAFTANVHLVRARLWPGWSSGSLWASGAARALALGVGGRSVVIKQRARGFVLVEVEVANGVRHGCHHIMRVERGVGAGSRHVD